MKSLSQRGVRLTGEIEPEAQIVNPVWTGYRLTEVESNKVDLVYFCFVETETFGEVELLFLEAERNYSGLWSNRIAALNGFRWKNTEVLGAVDDPSMLCPNIRMELGEVLREDEKVDADLFHDAWAESFEPEASSRFREIYLSRLLEEATRVLSEPPDNELIAQYGAAELIYESLIRCFGGIQETEVLLRCIRKKNPNYSYDA